MVDYIIDDVFVPLEQEPLDDDAPGYLIQFREMLREIDELTHYSLTRYQKIVEINRKIRVGELIEFRKLEETALVKSLREEIRVGKLALREKQSSLLRESSPESIPSPSRKRRQRRRKSLPLLRNIFNLNARRNAHSDEGSANERQSAQARNNGDQSQGQQRHFFEHETNYGSDTSIPEDMRIITPGKFFADVVMRSEANIKPLRFINSIDVATPHIHALRTLTKVLQSPYASTDLILVPNADAIAYCDRVNIPLRNITELPVTLKLIDVIATDAIELEHQINHFNDNITGHVIKIYSVPGNGKPYYNALIQAPLKCIPTLEQQGKMRLEGYMAKFFEVVDLKQCFKCTSYNHTTGRCLASRICKTCSSANVHNELECLPFCKQCHKEGFASDHKHRAHNCKSYLNAIVKRKNLVFQFGPPN